MLFSTLAVDNTPFVYLFQWHIARDAVCYAKKVIATFFATVIPHTFVTCRAVILMSPNLRQAPKWFSLSNAKTHEYFMKRLSVSEMPCKVS